MEVIFSVNLLSAWLHSPTIGNLVVGYMIQPQNTQVQYTYMNKALECFGGSASR